MRGDTVALVLSLLVLCVTLLVYKLGIDVRKYRIKKRRLVSKERLATMARKRWKEKER